MVALTSERLLNTWENGAQRHPIDRALLLFALAKPELSTEQLADIPLGTRNTALMAFRREHFGDRLPAWLDCPNCGERMEFELAAEQLPPLLAGGDESIRVEGYNFRQPTSRDLVGFANEHIDASEAVKELLYACAESPELLPQDDHALSELLDAVGEALESADPWADISLAIACPDCEAHSQVSFDIASYLWDEVDRRAQQLLDHIHALAKAYGWSEREILMLGEPRRAAYLAKVQA
jgi:rubredoxin